MTIKGKIECKINAGKNVIYTTGYDWIANNEAFVTMYDFFNNLSALGVTRIAYNRGSGGTGMTYWDVPTPATATKPGNGAWALFRFGNATIPFYVLLQGGSLQTVYTFTFSSYAGCTPCKAENHYNSDGTYIVANIAIAMRLDGSSPWNGTTNNNGTDTKGTPVWTPGASTLAVFPRCNSTYGTYAANREAVSPFIVSNVSTTLEQWPDAYNLGLRLSCVADENNFLILADGGGNGTSNPFFFGKYIPLSGITAQIPYVMLNYPFSSDTPAFPAVLYGHPTSFLDQGCGGICHPNATLGVKACQIAYPNSLLNMSYFPNKMSIYHDRFDVFPTLIYMWEKPWSGNIGTIDFLRWTFGTPISSTTIDKSWAILGGLGNQIYAAKLFVPWDGITTPYSGISRDGISF